ncbi:MAG: methyl-accepting chemotaxis protein, partial [Aeromonas veronii]
ALEMSQSASQLAQESELLAGLSRSLDERLAVFKLGKESAAAPMMAPLSPPSGEQRPRH